MRQAAFRCGLTLAVFFGATAACADPGKTFSFTVEQFASRHRAMSTKEGVAAMKLDECAEADVPTKDWNCYYNVSKGTTIALRAVSRSDPRVNRVRVMMAGDGRIEAKHMMRSILFSMAEIRPSLSPEEVSKVVDSLGRVAKDGSLQFDLGWAKTMMIHIPAAGAVWVEFASR